MTLDQLFINKFQVRATSKWRMDPCYIEDFHQNLNFVGLSQVWEHCSARACWSAPINCSAITMDVFISLCNSSRFQRICPKMKKIEYDITLWFFDILWCDRVRGYENYLNFWVRLKFLRLRAEILRASLLLQISHCQNSSIFSVCYLEFLETDKLNFSNFSEFMIHFPGI